MRTTDPSFIAIFQHSPQPMALLDADAARFLAVNDALLHCFGVAVEALLARPCDHLPWPEGLAVLCRSPLVTLGGHPARLILCHEVAAQQQADEARQEVAAHFRRIARNLPGMVYQCVIFPDGTMTFPYVSDGCRAIYGLSAAQIMARPALIFEAIHPQDKDSFTRSGTEAIETGQPWHWEGRIVTPDGDARWVRGDAHVERRPNGEVVSEGQFRDVTEQRQAQEVLGDAEQGYRGIFENALEGVFQTTPGGQYIRANAALARIYGYETPRALVAGLRDIGRTLYVDSSRRAEFVRLMQDEGEVSRFEAQVRRKDGAVIWISEHAHAVRDDRGQILYYEGTVQDITERREAEEALRRAEAGYRSIFEHAVEGIYRATAEGRLVATNPALTRMMGYESAHELMTDLARETKNYVDPARQDEFRRLMQEGDSVVGFEYQVYCKDGSVIWLSENARAGRDDAGQLLHYEGTVEDITTRKALEAERERLLAEALERADHDPLTGLLNHRAFHKRYAEELARADRDGTFLAVAVLDLDNFKFFNDSYGHAAGDDVLRRVAGALRGCCRPYDVLARFGGDEFALLMPGSDLSTAASLSDRLQTTLAGLGYRPEGAESAIPLSLSVGLAVYPEEGQDQQGVLEAADARLLRTKTGGSDDGEIESLRTLLRESFQGFSMLDALVTAVDNKDRYTRRHSEDVMRHVIQIAGALGLDAPERRTLQTAALLHDVGKIGVPDRILRKPDRLTEDEFQAVRQHPMMGAVMVGAVPGFEDTLAAIRHHHERWDGGGYPCGLRGREIPLMARVMAVADAFSAMTTDRPYRKGLSPTHALALLQEGAGVQWDSECVDAFARALGPRTGGTVTEQAGRRRPAPAPAAP